MVQPGSKVRIKTKHDALGDVTEIKDGFAAVLHDGEIGWFPISDLRETSDELLNRMIKGQLDDVADFVLAMDAYRLHTAQLWEPYVLAASNRIRVFPHQIYEVMWALDNPRTLVADEVGLGKTIIAALVSAELQARGIVKKALYIVPKSLILKWKDELDEKFQIDARILGSSYQRVDDVTFAGDEFSYISSIDYLKQDRIMEYLEGTKFDMVIIDEAHKMKLNTARMKLGRKVSEITRNLMLLTATPHDGHDDNFLARMNLLDPWISDVESSSHLWVRNIKEDVLDIDGKQVFPSRTSRTIKIRLSPAEEEVYAMLDQYMDARAREARTPQETSAVRFLKFIFRKRASSSIRALEISLKRRLDKLGSVDPAAVLSHQREMGMSEEEFDEKEAEENRMMIEGYTAGADIEQEKRELSGLIDSVRGLGGRDSKYDMIVESIKELKRHDSAAKLIVFTEYWDTLEFLRENLSGHYKVGTISGKLGIMERKNALAEFRDRNGNEILLCTDAAGEGIDMQFCNIEINYDLPWNPNKLEQRMGRIHRIGQTRDVFYHNFVIDSDRSIDGYIFTMLLEKIDRIRDAMDDKIYDILGRIITEEDIMKLYEELAEIPRAQWEPKVMELASKIEKNKERIVRENEKLLTANRFDRTNLEDINKIHKHAIGKGEIKRFVEMYLAIKEGSLEMLDKNMSMYRISMPREAARMLENPIFDGTFDGGVAIRNNIDYLALGNKNIGSMIRHTEKPSVTCLEHDTKCGLITVHKLTVVDGAGKARNARILCLFQNEDGRIDEVDPRSLWDYDGRESLAVNTKTLADFNKRSEAHAAGILKKFEDGTKTRMEKVKIAYRNITENHLATEAEALKTQIDEHRRNISSGPHMEAAIRNKEKKLAVLKEEYDDRIRQAEIEYATGRRIVMVGMAWVVPKMDANIRTEVDRAGQAAVMEYERNHAKTPEESELVRDVSDRDCGYDVESFGGKCIEVKSFKTTGSPKITSHEWETARRMRDSYWLYIVENAVSDPKITTFKNPFKIFEDTVHAERVVDYRYVINDWKEKVSD